MVGPHSTSEELKREYERKLEQLRELEAERAIYLSRGEPVPRRVRFRLEMIQQPDNDPGGAAAEVHQWAS